MTMSVRFSYDDNISTALPGVKVRATCRCHGVSASTAARMATRDTIRTASVTGQGGMARAYSSLTASFCRCSVSQSLSLKP